jgi:formylglycine-generating enzyme required for sulfatase activity
VIPEWYEKLPPASRPELPLPDALRFGEHEREYVNDKTGLVLVYVPGGRFTMGRPLATINGDENNLADELPRHEVDLSPYFIGKYEVSNANYEKFANGGVKTRAEESGGWVVARGTDEMEFHPAQDANWLKPNGKKPKVAEEPVVQLSWREAVAFARWAGLRLPTEAEWERAAAWDDEKHIERVFPWGDEREDDVAKWSQLDLNPDESTVPVTQFPGGVSPIGVWNMAGNVREFVLDLYSGRTYAEHAKQGAVKDPCVTEAEQAHCQRGGGFIDSPAFCRAAYRTYGHKKDGGDDGANVIGFRVAVSGRGHVRAWEAGLDGR